MHKKTIIFAILMISLTIPLAATDISYSGLSHTTLATRFSEGDIAHYKQSIDLSVDMYKGISHFFIQPYATISKDSPVSFDMREAYVEFYFDNMDLKIGKQIIVAGQADALFLTDIISPRNLSDFVLTETRDMKIGVPAIKSSFYLGSYTIDAIWITQAIPTTAFLPSSMWFSSPSLLPPSATITMTEPTAPDLSLKNSEVFAKLRYFGSSTSYEIVGGYTYSDEPHISELTITSQSPLNVTLEQAFGRYPVVGGSFSTAIGSVVLRGETNLSINKSFSAVTTTPAPSVDVEEHNYLQGLIGVDYSLFGVDMSSQYMVSFIGNYNDKIVHQGRFASEYSHLVTYRAQKKFFEDRFTFQLFSLIELDPVNALIRPSITYEIEDAVSVKAEVLLFVGDDDGLYGTYKDNSLTSVSLYWYF